MIHHKPISGMFFSCDHNGNILRVVQDDNSILSNCGLTQSFFDLFDNNNKSKSQEFWKVLQRDSRILEWELSVNTKPLPKVFKFSGFVSGDEFLITASKSDDFLMAMYDELMRINNEQTNLLRHSEKSLSTLKKKESIKVVDILNEMTLLNNELVNTQRQLMKQNGEVTRLNKQLQQMNADLEQFNYVASHDLKEPLRMVTSFVKLLKNKYGSQLDEIANKYIDFALVGGMRMQNMITNLLELSRTGSKNATKEMTDLNDVLKVVKENLFKLIEETQATIIVKNDLPNLTVYKPDIARLFQNLLSNAIKFRKKDIKPVIQVSATEKEQTWLFSIEDNGIGIAKEKFKKIFDIFSRLHTHEAYEGSGIGLSICKKIVEHNGGEIWVESEEGKGSAFCFSIKK